MRPLHTGRNIFDGLNETAHHEHGTLDSLLVQVVLLARDVVGAHDAGLHAGADLSGEDAAESVEAALIGGWYHFRDVHHKRSLGIAVLDADGGLIIKRTLVQHFHTVALGCGRGWQMDGNHLEKGVTSGQPLTNDSWKEQTSDIDKAQIRADMNYP